MVVWVKELALPRQGEGRQLRGARLQVLVPDQTGRAPLHEGVSVHIALDELCGVRVGEEQGVGCDGLCGAWAVTGEIA